MGGGGGQRLFKLVQRGCIFYMEPDSYRRGGNGYLKQEKKTLDCVGSVSIAWSPIRMEKLPTNLPQLELGTEQFTFLRIVGGGALFKVGGRGQPF